MTSRYHLLTSIEAQIRVAELSTAIAIIDESTPPPASLSADWANFRATFPTRPYFIIQPTAGPNGQGSQLNIPANMQTAIINEPFTRAFILPQTGFAAYNSTPDASVFPNGFTRDGGNVNLATDLFAVCGLNTLPPNTSIFLFVDNSGSMTLADVRATLNLFQTRCNTAGLRVRSVFNIAENYVLPFVNFVGTPGVP